MKKADPKTLPKWAQQLISERDQKINELFIKLHNLEKAHSVLHGREWFTINGPRHGQPCVEPDGMYRLFMLGYTGAHCVATLKVGDTLLIGRQIP